jgi:hypothetical protein
MFDWNLSLALQMKQATDVGGDDALRFVMLQCLEPILTQLL